MGLIVNTEMSIYSKLTISGNSTFWTNLLKKRECKTVNK